jgi:hypothetical protein
MSPLDNPPIELVIPQRWLVKLGIALQPLAQPALHFDLCAMRSPSRKGNYKRHREFSEEPMILHASVSWLI